MVTISDESCWYNLPFIHSTVPWPLLPPGQFITCMRSDFVFAAQKNHIKSLFPVIYIQQQAFLRNVSNKIFQQTCQNSSENSNVVPESRNTPWMMSLPELTDYIFIWINCSWATALALLMHNWHSTSNLFFLSLFYWKDKCSMLNECRNPLSFLADEHLCAYTSRALLSLSSPLSRNPFWIWWDEAHTTVYSFEHKLIFHLLAWKDPVDEPWLIISRVHYTVIRGKHLGTRSSKTRTVSRSLVLWMPSVPARLPINRGCFFFWLIQVGNASGSTKNSRVFR